MAIDYDAAETARDVRTLQRVLRKQRDTPGSVSDYKIVYSHDAGHCRRCGGSMKPGYCGVFGFDEKRCAACLMETCPPLGALIAMGAAAQILSREAQIDWPAGRSGEEDEGA